MAENLKSSYFLQLGEIGKKRYEEKLQLLGLNEDPYLLPPDRFSTDMDLWPSLEFPDIYMYLINSPSPCTKEEFKAYKSSKAWSYFVAGFVQDVMAMKLKSDIVVLKAKVKHSQAMNALPLQPWVGVKQNGDVVCAHCNCMAGAGEACSHIAALMYAIMSSIKLRQETTSCTSVQCRWLAPSLTKKIDYVTIDEIAFFKPNKRLRCSLEEEKLQPPKRKPCCVLSNTQQVDQDEFYAKLSETNPKAAILSLVPKYSNGFQSESNLLPQLLTEFYKPDYLTLPYHLLLDECEKVFDMIHVTGTQAKKLEQDTRSQAQSKLWFNHRAGRLTASRIKSIVTTDVEMPSKSLITSICYSKAYKFESAATRWGCTHEQGARVQYAELSSSRHRNFKIRSSGFVVNPKYPHLGASPDGIISCDCCGTGTLEIKCPYCLKDSVPLNAPFVDEDHNLKKDHAYFYQVQMQSALCEFSYSDFVVWSPSGISIERIKASEEFFTSVVDNATVFYKQCLLPELIGKWYTRQSVFPEVSQLTSTTATMMLPLKQTLHVDTPEAQDTESSGSSLPVYCYCKEDKDNCPMIGCDYASCKVEWFHLSCLKMKSVPKGKWYCPDCRKLFKGKHPPKNK